MYPTISLRVNSNNMFVSLIGQIIFQTTQNDTLIRSSNVGTACFAAMC